MAIDRALEEGLRIAVEEEGQPSAVAQRLIAWIEALSGGGVGEENSNRFYENVRDALLKQGADDED